jgi:dTDP-4-dehydrorhamnose reductase
LAFLRATSFDALLNATSYHKTDEVEGNADRAMAVNAVAPALMAEICAEKGARFLHVSTDYVFGGDAARTTPLEETDPTAPVNVYGLSKQFGETLIGLVGGDSTVLRRRVVVWRAGRLRQGRQLRRDDDPLRLGARRFKGG